MRILESVRRRRDRGDRAARGTSAQSVTGTITGTVRDASGGAIPGATVRVVNEKTRGAVDTTSDGQGAYRVAELPAGSYRLETTLDGFEPAARVIALESGQTASIELTLTPARLTEGVVVTARRVEEAAQDVPIPLSVVNRNLVENAGAFNVNRLKELIPTVQFYSTNPRNSAINIRGLGAPFGLTNDGLEPGVGLYIDGVFYARPASATLDFLDVERIEVLRGPQGTLFGKNTTAGAINVTTRKPSFTRGADFELNLGDVGFVQAKASATGPLGKKVAARVSFSGTERGGTIYNAQTQREVNDLNNAGIRGQMLVAPSDNVAVTWTTDYTRQRPEGYTQVVAGVAPTLRPANRQYPQIAADLDYTPPSFNAFDRVTDVDSPLRSYQDLGGSSLNLDWKVGRGLLTSTTGWRFWNWNPSNDRDFIGLPVTTVSAAPSTHRQWSEEVRYAGLLASRVNYVVGGFAFHQTIDSDPSFKQEQGSAAARFLLAPTAGGGDAGIARRLRLQSVHPVLEYERGGVRPGRHRGDESPAAAARPALQLRPEESRLRSADLRRPADDRSGAHRAATLGARATAVPGGRRRHEPVRSVHGVVSRVGRGSTRTRRMPPASSRSDST